MIGLSAAVDYACASVGLLIGLLIYSLLYFGPELCTNSYASIRASCLNLVRTPPAEQYSDLL